MKYIIRLKNKYFILSIIFIYFKIIKAIWVTKIIVTFKVVE